MITILDVQGFNFIANYSFDLRKLNKFFTSPKDRIFTTCRTKFRSHIENNTVYTQSGDKFGKLHTLAHALDYVI